jgi:hypothetical protein
MKSTLEKEKPALDVMIGINDWVEFRAADGEIIQGKLLRVKKNYATVDVLRTKPLKCGVKFFDLTPIAQPVKDDDLPEHLLSETAKRHRLPREQWTEDERKIFDYFDNVTDEEFEQHLKDTDFEYYSKIRTPSFMEDVIAYPIVKSRKRDLTGRIIDGMDWQPSCEGDGLRGKHGTFWMVVPRDRATHVYVKHFYPAPKCMLEADILPLKKK